ncbi:hypothetical protein [Polaribacter sp.]|jgi:uncharacterized membrane protein YjgN (DUF898 family)|uniref:hypothetical protein n=1 Tax=Polaribacter sp. TaxID=1920175 RepID=UPI000715F553|nr:MAG: hypothetical protein ABS28_04945 [Cryomorphaceae bacterium BACL22 MAG-120619-bin32]
MSEPIIQLAELKLNSEAKSYLLETAKWAFFLSIVGFVGIALLVIVALFASTIFNSIQEMQSQVYPFNIGKMITIIYLVMAAIYLFPVYYLMQFANKMKAALANTDDVDLTASFEMLKSHYKFIGVFTIIILSLYAMAFVVGMLGVFEI